MKRNLTICGIVATLTIAHAAYGQYADRNGWGQPSQLGQPSQRVQPNYNQQNAQAQSQQNAGYQNNGGYQNNSQFGGFAPQQFTQQPQGFGTSYPRQDQSPSDTPIYNGPMNQNAPGANQGAPIGPGGQQMGQGNHADGNGAGCGGGNNPYSNAMNGGWNGGGCGPSGCGTDGFDAGRLAQARSANWVGGINVLFFNRDYEDDRGLSYQNGMPSLNLHTTDADLGGFSGVEGFIGRRGCNGLGWEARYWGLFPGDASTSLVGTPYTVLQGLNYVDHPPSGFNAYQIFNSANTHTITRDNEFHNFEFNMLRNGGCITTRRCNTINFEMLAGVRYFKFDEYMRYFAFNTAPYPTSLSYDISTENELLGLQLGGRTTYQLKQCWSFNLGTKFGIYENQISHSQRIIDGNGMYGVINTGPYAANTYNFMSEKEDVSFIGELDMGLSYQFSQCARLNFGYRAMAITGIALVPDQIPFNFADQMEINRINSNGSLILHGAYAGLEYCF
jgi:hypothetical protein